MQNKLFSFFYLVVAMDINGGLAMHLEELAACMCANASGGDLVESLSGHFFVIAMASNAIESTYEKV